ncbi:IAA-amino acid hydrolase ILR1-like 1 [Gracilariopsis chorda]|uniref:IAA-amino acid hydrolase ILR1-like 1 n=1 Tax=Gracilariopsis chorda TaxID=448386 RepID=A0A2V3IRV7_9FLOR|nr:IAA-amino acid hydrolase ILR1-like 1 [Gracilariopsis chorda]|eukprot:PXF44457.1 IAA-amino acid hydrolase ILR1-like 1 [Gracilariopsis chorda]
MFPTAPTAIIAVFTPENSPLDGALKPILLRGDMDALPMAGSPEEGRTVGTSIQEGCHMPGSAISHSHATTTSDQPSIKDASQLHHGCGHDGHTAMMLITAHWIQENQDKVHRKVVVFFQPAEEARRESDNMSGAEVVIREGLFEAHPDIHAVYGVHGGPGMPVGNFLTGKSAMMAGSGGFTIAIDGTGGHAANPGREQSEPLLAASAIVTCGQTIIARRFEPNNAGVLAFCVVDTLGATAGNVCPGKVEVRGSIRAFNDKDWDYIADELGRISKHIGEAYNCKAEFFPSKGYPVTTNSPHAGEISYNAAATVLKDNKSLNVYTVGYGVGEVPPATGSEDFSYLLLCRPGAFAFLSIGDDFTTMHTPEVKFPAEALKYGGRYFREIVVGPDCTDPLPPPSIQVLPGEPMKS